MIREALTGPAATALLSVSGCYAPVFTQRLSVWGVPYNRASSACVVLGGTQLIGSDTAIPFSITWSNVPAGTYSLTAVATDNEAATATSQPVSVTVAATANKPPTVSISAPATGANYTAPANIAVSATAG